MPFRRSNNNAEGQVGMFCLRRFLPNPPFLPFASSLSWSSLERIFGGGYPPYPPHPALSIEISDLE
jgi:hypothetical protein